jgi:hypothetical protein
MTTNVQANKEAYNLFSELSHLSYECIAYLMEHDEEVWKLLKYNDAEAWKKADLTHDEKAALVFNGLNEMTDYRVFMDTGQPDVFTEQVCVLRVSPFNMSPENRTVATITMHFEVYSHYRINTLTNYTTRTDAIIQRILEVFNGAQVFGIGRLTFSLMANNQVRADVTGVPPFRGRWLLMANKVA